MTDDGKDVFSFDDEDCTIALDDDDTITLTGWDNSLTTSLSGGYSLNTYPATTISSGTVGATLSTTNVGSLMWNNSTYPTTVTTGSLTNGYGVNLSSSGHNLHVNGGAIFEEDIKVKGVLLSERLDAIEERLGILRPNNDLEGKWEKLKRLGDEYRKLEKEILEGEQIWDMLKK